MGAAGTWTGTDPAGTATSVGLARLSGFGSGSLSFYNARWTATSSRLIVSVNSTAPGSQQAYGSGFLVGAAPPTNVSSFTNWGSMALLGPQTFRMGTTFFGANVYVGFRVVSGAGLTSYYWVEVTPTATELTISDYGALAPPQAAGGGGPGSQPSTGTPEPVTSGLGLLALGAAGVLRHKRRRRAVA